MARLRASWHLSLSATPILRNSTRPDQPETVSEVVIADHLTSAFYGWSIEVTFAEVRRHRGVESQRRWSDLAISRTTSALFGLFSLVTLWAGEDAPLR
jgi:hypothetical protein